MSLQVWLPLRGNLDNYGLTNVTVTNNGATVNNAGKIGQCYSFNGSSYIDTGYVENFGVGNFTISAWIYFVQTAGKTWQCIVGNKSTTGKSVGCAIYWNQNQKKFLWSTADGTTAKEIWSVDTFDSILYDSWHHIVMVRDNNDPKKGYFYFDGVRKEIASVPTMVNVSSTTTMKIGSCTPTSSNYFYTGKINDVRVYDHALSKKEVHDIAQALVLHYTMDDEQSKNVNPFYLSESNYDKSDYVNRTTGTITDNLYHVDGYQSETAIDTSFSATTKSYITLQANTDYYLSFWCKSKSAADLFFGTSGHAYTTLMGSSNARCYPTTQVTLGTEFDGWVNLKIHTGTDTQYKINLGFDGPNIWGVGSYIEFSNVMLSLTKPSCYIPYNSSSTIHDCSGYLNDGTIIGNLETIEGSPRYDKCTLFSQSATNYIRIPNAALAGPYSNKELTFSFWINAQQKGSRHMIFGIVGSYNTNIELYTANELRIYWAGTPDWRPGINCTVGEWMHIGVVVTSTYIKCYKNGVLIGTNNTTPNWAGCTQDLLIGSDQRIGSYFLGSKLSDFRIYATVLSDDDIKELYDTAAYIHNTGNLSGYEITETAKNLLQYENTLMYTNTVNTSVSRGKYVERNGVVAMAFQARDTYFGAGDERNDKLLYGFFKANTRYLFDLWMDVDDVIYQDVNKPDGFIIKYTDGTTSGNSMIVTGTTNPYTGWQHKVIVSDANKTIQSLTIYYWTSVTFFVRADSCIVELSETDIAKTGVITSGQFIEDTDVAFIGKATFNSNHIIEI